MIRLGELFTQTGESLAKAEGQTLARWLVLGTLAEGPEPVAEVARRLRLTRQSVQRVADVLADDGLVAYEDNPRHRRAKLARLTPEGSRLLARIDAGQRAWANLHGAEVGLPEAERAAALLERIRGTLTRPASHG